MARQLYTLLNSRGQVDCIERDIFDGKSIPLPRLFGSLASARYSASKYCENIGGHIVTECCAVVKVRLVVEPASQKKAVVGQKPTPNNRSTKRGKRSK